MLIDRYGRQMTYLRVSVTDRCNFRCVYCMPAEGVARHTHQEIIRYEEIAAIVRVAATQGIREVRLTGGEPLVRKDLPDLVRMIAAIPGIEDISLTTNAILLEELAGPLAQAGLRRVNVSLDTLNSEKFARISRGGAFERSWRGIVAAEAHGLTPIKLNMVVLRGVNDDELLDMASLSLTHPWHVRFIELMPVNNQQAWGPGFPDPAQMYVSIQEMLERLEVLGLERAHSGVGSGPAQEYRLRGGLGTVGFISPLGDAFCGECNRLRLTADGNLRPCLLSDVEIPVLAALRAGQPILPLLQAAVEAKPMGHELSHVVRAMSRCMQQIGG